MTSYNIKYLLTLALLTVLEFSFAQSDINQLNRYSHVWTRGNECIELQDGNILLAGKASDSLLQQQSFHISLHDKYGNILNSNFIYDTIHPHSVGHQRNMIQVNSNEVFYCYNGFLADCFYYDLDDYSLYEMDAFGWMEEDSINITPYVIKNVNDTLLISGNIYDAKTGRYDYVITKIKDKQLISRTIIDYPNYNIDPNYGRDEIFCIDANNYFAYIHTDRKGPYLYHFLNDTVHNIITLDPDYYLHSAYLNGDNNIILSTHKFTEEGNIRYKSMKIAEIDLEGNTLWENDLESYVERTICFMNGMFYSTCLQTFIDKIIPAVDGNGYIYIGSEHVSEGSDQYSNAIIGKIDVEGNVLWNRKYRYYDTVPGYNGFHDIEPDQFGGYIIYGDIVSQDFELVPYWRRAWLMRVDEEGILIDTTVNTLNPTLKGYQDFSINPNPAKSNIQLSKSLTDISIRDINGQLIISLKDQKINQIDISSLSSGIYIVIGQADDGDWYRSKFVKE